MLDDHDKPPRAPAGPSGPEQAPSRNFLDQLIGELPRLRGAAVMMARTRADADDLIQTTAARAIAAHRQFTPGTNMRAWLYRILRNEFIDMVRVRDRHASRLDDVPDEFLKRPGTQEDALTLRDVQRAMNTLTHIHREALFLLCVEGLSYEQIADVQGCAVGTIKSRISRARQDMKTLLEQSRGPLEDDLADAESASRLLAAAGAIPA